MSKRRSPLFFVGQPDGKRAVASGEPVHAERDKNTGCSGSTHRMALDGCLRFIDGSLAAGGG